MDGRTYYLVANTALHSMQRGKTLLVTYLMWVFLVSFIGRFVQ